jgi:hypothetical protein
MVCVTPVKPSYDMAASACVEPGETGSIHFPDETCLRLRVSRVRRSCGSRAGPWCFPKEHVFAGRLEGIPVGGEVGPARVNYR